MLNSNGKVWVWRIMQMVAGLLLAGITITTPLVCSSISNIHKASHALSERLAGIEATVPQVDSQVDALSAWRDTWVNRVRELDATQSSSIQFLKDSLTEVKLDLRSLKAQCRVDASEFHRLLLDIRDRMPALKTKQ